MNTHTIEIDGADYEIKFGFAANFILTKKWKVKTLTQVGEKIASKLNFKEETEPDADQLAALGDLIHAGILAKSKNAKLTRDDCVDFILSNPEQMGSIIELYVGSMPKSPEPGKNVKRVK